MSMHAPDSDQAGARLAAERSRALGRSRRSGEGSVTEMARSLLRDAREAERRTPPRRRRPGAATVRLRPLPISARRA